MFIKQNMLKINIEHIIGKNSAFIGSLRFKNGMEVDGQVRGHIKGEGGISTILIKKTGTVEGGIVCDNVIVSGKVSGPIYAKIVHIKASGIVIGNITANEFNLEAGGIFNGNLNCKEKLLPPEHLISNHNKFEEYIEKLRIKINIFKYSEKLEPPCNLTKSIIKNIE